MHFPSSKMLVVLLGSAMLATAGMATAQERPETPEPPEAERPTPNIGQQQKQPDVDVSDNEVQQFADIYHESMKIRSKYAGQAQNAKNREEAMKLRKDMNQEMMKVIKDSPMTVQRYRTIARAASSDPELQQELKQAIKQ